MKDKYLYIVDIRFKQKKFSLSHYGIEDNSEILSLTPYSSYLLDLIGQEHKTFHDIISELKFRNIILDEYTKIEKAFFNYQNYSFLFRDLAFIKTFEVYLKVLFEFLNKKKLEKYNIIYLTDAERASGENINNNIKSYVYHYDKIDKVIKINNHDNFFNKKNNFYFKISMFRYKANLFSKIVNKYLNNSENKIELNYDNTNFKNIYEHIESFSIKKQLSTEDIDKLGSSLKNILINKEEMQFIAEKYNNVLKDFRKKILSYLTRSTINLHPFTFLSTTNNYIEILLYKKNNIPTIFMQHGSYTTENIFLKNNEIYPSDINFVFNDFTKNLFEKRGAKKVYSVGSIDINYSIIEKEKKYDFLYITYCTSYSHTGTYIGSSLNVLSTDAMNIFEKHKKIIELFGNKFKDKKICFKVQPTILTGSMLYIPFLELSKEYKNITIEFTIPVSKLIEKSKYIISDYFSSEFINRELHYKRDIILFQGLPIPLPDEILEDMKKMFILVDTIDDLKETVENMEYIRKNRKRYDDIIEYYSSKKCDTKKIVTEILEKELNAGR